MWTPLSDELSLLEIYRPVPTRPAQRASAMDIDTSLPDLVEKVTVVPATAWSVISVRVRGWVRRCCASAESPRLVPMSPKFPILIFILASSFSLAFLIFSLISSADRFWAFSSLLLGFEVLISYPLYLNYITELNKCQIWVICCCCLILYPNSTII